jgi:RNA polymerase sigma-70 factor (ECF subfamily)
MEDCVADVLCEFYAKLDRYDLTLSSIKSYLCVLARHKAIDILRKRARQSGDISLDGEVQIADDIDIESELEESELRREVFDAIKALGEPDTSIIVRKYYLGESSAEIAKALDLTISNVDTRAHRTLNKLRNLFGGEGK